METFQLKDRVTDAQTGRVGIITNIGLDYLGVTTLYTVRSSNLMMVREAHDLQHYTED